MPTIVLKAVYPRRKFRETGLRVARSLEARLLNVAKQIQEDFESTTASWERPVLFKVNPFHEAGGIGVFVGTEDEVYAYVARGTRPHIIRPKTAKALSFQWGGPGSYKPKTAPMVIGSHAGGPTGDQVEFRHVMHPGTQAREFDRAIAEKWQKILPSEMRIAVRQAL